ncbi:MAG TPA: hypothetical protein VKE70_32275 [Candidatus Solibacter sp.]|nr:hypothetical protein [Candidatus Solibacter sp.]
MKIVETTLATESREQPVTPDSLIVRMLYKLIPRANPDFDGCYCKVRTWWVEVDDAGMPQRELGFGAEGKVTVAGPLGRNHGFWTDSNMTLILPNTRLHRWTHLRQRGRSSNASGKPG